LLLAAALLIVVMVIGVNIWLFLFPSVDYRLDENSYYQSSDGVWSTLNKGENVNGTFIPVICKNSGLFGTTFEVTVTFSGVTFSNKTDAPYQQISESCAKFSFHLAPFEEQKVNVYFTIQNQTRFNVKLTLTSTDLLMHVADPHHSWMLPWDVSYRELFYSLSNDKFYPALIE
jgi:hypothetical protein